MTSILCIPDCHSKPESNKDRFTWLGKYISEEQPDIIVCLGDFMDMGSLSSYDRGKGTGEKRRVKEDFAAGFRDARELFKGTKELNAYRRRQKKGPYEPRKVFLDGNHEYRANKWENDNPEFIGMVAEWRAPFDALWDEVVPFKQPYTVEGIAFNHFFPSAMGRAIGGKNAARSIMLHNMTSCVSGHSHKLDVAVETRGDGQKLFGLVAGWYGWEDHSEEWSKGADHAWWSGITLLEGVQDGFPSKFSFISQQQLKDTYGQ